jgi:hypothetical protein
MTTNITTITVDNSVTEIGVGSSLAVIAVDNSVTEIGVGSLQAVIAVDNSVTDIGYPSLIFSAFEVYFIPSFADNEAALNGGLSAGDLYRDSDGKIKVTLNRVNLILNLSKAVSYFLRGFR